MTKRKTRRPAAKRAPSRGNRSSRKSRRSSVQRSWGKLPKRAVTLTVVLRPREGQELLLEAELRALIAPTRKEEGCIAYDLHRSLAAPAAFFLHEIWATREHHASHSKSPHFLRWDARKDALLAGREAAFWQRLA